MQRQVDKVWHYPCICATLLDEFNNHEALQMLVRACDGARQLRMKFALFRSQLLKAERLKVATGCQACLLSPEQTRLHVTANASQTCVVGEVSWRACSKYRRPGSRVSCAFKCAATRSLSWLREACSTRLCTRFRLQRQDRRADVETFRGHSAGRRQAHHSGVWQGQGEQVTHSGLCDLPNTLAV